ncbi:hypothetical protein SDC9_138128 [bioreactor metagenome]|uniref:Uncharacterized protein n=1 Tax=bioreactor metagenome TaxID=1076179 RepID=A0A645DQL4_9ZZZZ
MAAGLRGEVVAVDGVPAVRRQGGPGPGFGVLGAGLGVLAGDPADLHDRHLRGVRHHDRHRQQGPQLVLDVGGRDAGEGLRTVAALQDETLTTSDGSQLGPQVVALPREHQRRAGPQLGQDVGQLGLILIARLLDRIHGMQLLEGRES